jgi:ribose transport system ATP-binding protein
VRAAARAALTRLGHGEIPLGRPVGRLPAAAQQIVSMARALSREARMFIMDEPSAVLAHDEVSNLLRIIRELRDQGIAVVYISHRLEAIRQICDRVTVLRDGRTTAADLPATTPTAGVPHREAAAGAAPSRKVRRRCAGNLQPLPAKRGGQLRRASV